MVSVAKGPVLIGTARSTSRALPRAHGNIMSYYIERKFCFGGQAGGVLHLWRRAAIAVKGAALSRKRQRAALAVHHSGGHTSKLP